MSVRRTRRLRTTARLAAIPAALAVVTLAAAPASAHVTVTPSDANAGAFTVLSVSVPHGCDGAATTKVEVQIPEQILSVTPTRNPFWDVKPTIVELDEPTTDSHGNEVTERTGTVTYTAKEPLPDGVRDTFELSFQVPDVVGETLAFPTIQSCEKGEVAWIEVPEAGQDAEELENPAPSFEVLPAAEEGGHSDAGGTASEDTETASADTDSTDAAGETASDDSDMVGWAGLGVGALGLVVGGTALARSRRTS